MTDQIVVGAGFGRTGTLSLRAALNMLNVGPTYHMLENIKNNDHHKWIEVNEAGTRAEEEKLLRKILTEKGFKSSVDFPSSVMFKEICQLSPEAKVLLSVRDSPDAWVKSVKNTIFCEEMGTRTIFGRLPGIKFFVDFIPWLPFQRMARMKKLMNRMFLGKETKWDDETMKQVYIDWIEHVKRVVPSDKLLIFNVKQGWAPLCKFLNVHVPAEPFPRVNDTAEFQRRFVIIDIVTMVSLVVFYGGLGAAGYYCSRQSTVDYIKNLAAKFIKL